MGVVLHLYVCLFVYERTERKLYLYETPMYFNYVAFLYILCHIMLIGVILC